MGKLIKIKDCSTSKSNKIKYVYINPEYITSIFQTGDFYRVCFVDGFYDTEEEGFRKLLKEYE